MKCRAREVLVAWGRGPTAGGSPSLVVAVGGGSLAASGTLPSLEARRLPAMASSLPVSFLVGGRSPSPGAASPVVDIGAPLS
jgi:hypothetical protein